MIREEVSLDLMSQDTVRVTLPMKELLKAALVIGLVSPLISLFVITVTSAFLVFLGQ